jgi:hypothetical protein
VQNDVAHDREKGFSHQRPLPAALATRPAWTNLKAWHELRVKRTLKDA